MKPNGLLCHDILTENMKPKLSFEVGKNYSKWKNELRKSFIETTGLDVISENACEPQLEIEAERQKDGYRQIRFSFYSEVGAVVTAYLLVPDGIEGKRPVVITLQGHSTGFHNSIKEPKFPQDNPANDPDKVERTCFAVQAVREGYVALAIEQRGMGERAAKNSDYRRVHLEERAGCYYEAVTAGLLGRTLIGERVWDIKCAIDVLSSFDFCDLDKIAITGNSGGGTASYYAACYDERIKICMPSSSFCPYKESILRFFHCACNYIPGAYKYYDMQDLSCLIAPRQLTVVTGQLDPSFLVEGVRRGFTTVEKVYERENARDKAKLIITPNGHFWNVDIMWREMKKAFSDI